MSLLKEIQQLKNNDYVVLEDGTQHTIKCASDGRPQIVKNEGRKVLELEDFMCEIAEVIPYYGYIGYAGAKAIVNSYALADGKLVYLNISGQEQYVNSILSVLLQGKITHKKLEVVSGDIGKFSVYKNGNKRIVENVGNGICTALFYHSPSIYDDSANVILGNSQETVFNSFENWLVNSQPIPYPEELNTKIYDSLISHGFFKEIETKKLFGYEISKELEENDWEPFRKLIIKLCIDNDLIGSKSEVINKEYKRKLPRSKYLTKKQVNAIYEKLDTIPDTYALDDVSVKPVGVKLFGPNMTYYIVESNKYTEGFEEFTSCFGYIQNHTNEAYSEWGYISVKELLEVTINIPMLGTSQHMIGGFEMDLYYENMYLTSSGEELTQREYDALAKDSK